MCTRNFVPVIGLVGGVGSGKSAVARWLGERRSLVVVDGDSIGHQVLKLPEIKQQIRLRFGETIFNEQGEVDRKRLGAVVFGTSEEHRPARADLEKIVHPEIRREIHNRIQAARTSGEYEAVILDAAVMLEAGWNDMCNVVVFVDASEQCRSERVAGSRGWDVETLKSREASQLSLQEKKQASDDVIDNSGSLKEAGLQLENILERVLKKKSDQ